MLPAGSTGQREVWGRTVSLQWLDIPVNKCLLLKWLWWGECGDWPFLKDQGAGAVPEQPGVGAGGEQGWETS